MIFLQDDLSYPICVRDASLLFQAMMTSNEEQGKCQTGCPSDCTELKFKVSRDTRLVLARQECSKDEVLQAALKNYLVLTHSLYPFHTHIHLSTSILWTNSTGSTSALAIGRKRLLGTFCLLTTMLCVSTKLLRTLPL